MQYQYTQQYHSFASAIHDAFYNALHYPDYFDVNKSLAEINAGIFNDRTKLYSSYYHDAHNPMQLYYAVDSTRQAFEINNQLSFWFNHYLSTLSQPGYRDHQPITEKILNNFKLLLYHTAIATDSLVANNGLGNIFFYDYKENMHKNIASSQLDNYNKFQNYQRPAPQQISSSIFKLQLPIQSAPAKILTENSPSPTQTLTVSASAISQERSEGLESNSKTPSGGQGSRGGKSVSFSEDITPASNLTSSTDQHHLRTEGANGSGRPTSSESGIAISSTPQPRSGVNQVSSLAPMFGGAISRR